MAIASADSSPKYTLPLKLVDPTTVEKFEAPKTLATPLDDASDRDRVPCGVTEIDVAVQTHCQMP